MQIRGSDFMILVTAGAALGCFGGSASPGPGGPALHVGNGTVIGTGQLHGGSSSLLHALRSHVSGLRIESGTECPVITMRGRKSVSRPNAPVVYVDGTRTSDTCVLEALPPVQVERMEVYPTGVTQRPGYRSNPGGLILIFLKGSETGRGGEAGA